MKYSREVYNILDLLGDLGGVLEVIEVVIGFFLVYISEFSYNLEVMGKLFVARTKEEDLLAPPSEKYKQRKLKTLSKKANEEI